MDYNSCRAPDTDDNDFRAPAVRESLRILETSRGSIPADCSLCIPTNFDGLGWRGHGFGVLFRFVLGVACLSGGIVTGLLAARLGNPANYLSAVGVAVAVGGVLILFSQSFFQARFVRRHVAERYDDLIAMSGQGKPLCVNLEDAGTFHRLKILPEDSGYLALEPSGRRLLIEGVRFRYFIRGQDMLNVQEILGGNMTAPAITYLVGSATLSLAVQCVGIRNELRQQAPFARRDPVMVLVRELLAGELGPELERT